MALKRDFADVGEKPETLHADGADGVGSGGSTRAWLELEEGRRSGPREAVLASTAA